MGRRLNRIIILDFGSQTTHLIGRKIKELGVEAKILEGDVSLEEIKRNNPAGIILSGSPASVYAKNSPHPNKKIFESGLPILGICYGLQLIVYHLDGKVVPAKKCEFGPARLKTLRPNPLFAGIPKNFQVWMSHGDKLVKLPQGFKILASTKDCQATAVVNPNLRIFGVQFHPEVRHTQFGRKILANFVLGICRIKAKRKRISIRQIVKKIKERIKDGKAICALSGGVDSTTAAVLVHKAIGKNLNCTFIDTGLMRTGEAEEVKKNFQKLGIPLRTIGAQKEFLAKLRAVSDPEEKRKIIGETFIRVFEKEAEKIGAKFLVQGTIYPDIIESKGSKKAARIKTHHNVGGLPLKHRFTLVEPLRDFYKDEVRELARRLGLPERMISRQVFPGPGLAIRIIGEVTPKKLKILRQADKIVEEEIKKAGFYENLWMSFAVLVGAKTTAVMGDQRVYGETIAVRAIESQDAMTANWARLPYGLLQKISSRIVNEVPGVCRVVYDITTKPPATMEWE